MKYSKVNTLVLLVAGSIGTLMLITLIYIICQQYFQSTQHQIGLPLLQSNRRSKILNHFIETTPFVWNGKLNYLVVERDTFSKSVNLAIYDLGTNTRIAKFGANLNLASAIVSNNTLYIVATRKWGVRGSSQLYLIATNDLLHFSIPKLIYSALPDQSFFNTSITWNSSSKKFIIALETDEANYVAFSIRFIESSDLIHWQLSTKKVFGKDIYAACPTIRFFNGKYYMWYLVQDENDPNNTKSIRYIERLAKSSDLNKWETSPYDFLVPNGKDEGISTSDIDLVEYKNKVYIFYAAGDQESWSNVYYLVYNSSLVNLLNQFFK